MKKKIGIYLINIIGIVSGILTIITFLSSICGFKFKKIYITIDINIFLKKWSVWIFISAFIILIFSLLVKIKINRIESAKKDYFIKELNNILSDLYEYSQYNKRKHDKDLNDFVIDVLAKLNNIISIYTARPIYLRLMMIEDKEKKYVKEKYSSADNWQENGDALHKISDNTAFYFLMGGDGEYFCYSIKDRIFEKFYKTSDINWRRKYSSLLTVPIKSCGEKDDIIGFLCLYSIDKNVFDINSGVIITSVKTISFLLGTILQ